MFISLAGIGYSSYSLYENFSSYYVSAKKYEQLEEIYNLGVGAKDEAKRLVVDLNQDYIGWLNISGTKVNYPVVQADDNDFYLSHNFYMEQDFAGAIFMDYRNTTTSVDQNNIIYGHNMKDGSMFGSLKNYLNEDFYEEHKLITLDFLDSTYKWEVFSVYTSADVTWMKTTFQDDQEYGEYLEKVVNRSRVTTDIEVEKEDVILTLSTCTVDDHERFIVHAKLINVEESN